MTKKLLTLCFLLSLHFINCSDCTDKAILNEGEDIEICYSLNADPIELACVYDSTTGGCVEKQCSELDPSHCGAARPLLMKIIFIKTVWQSQINQDAIIILAKT